MEELTGEWHLRERFFGGYDVYVEVKRYSYPTKHYRKMRAGEEIQIYNLNNKKQVDMKTPIEQLIVKLEDLRDSIPDSDAMYRGGVINAIRLAKDMIEKEKEVITDAYNDGWLEFHSIEQDAEKYYNDTFKNK